MREEPEIVKILKEEEKIKNQESKEENRKYKFMDGIHKEKFIKEVQEEIQNDFKYQNIKQNNFDVYPKSNSELNTHYNQTNTDEESIIDLEFETKINRNGSVLNVESEGDINKEDLDKERTFLDDIDRVIIDLVRVNRWLSPSDIAKLIDCSHTAVKYRMFALYKAGLLYEHETKIKKNK